MNLQLFAEGAPPETPSTPPVAEGETKQFTQEEVDALIESRLSEYKSGENQRIENAKSEAQRLAQMTESERAAEALRVREEEVTRRESDLARRELRAQALETLAEKGLDKSLADLLDYGSAETCSASIDRMEKAFRAAVQAGVEQRLKSGGGSLPRSEGAAQENPDETMALRLAKINAEADRAANDIISRYM